MKKTIFKTVILLLAAVLTVGVAIGVCACDRNKNVYKVTFDLVVNSDNTAHVRYAELIKSNLADIGIGVNIITKDTSAFRAATTNGFSNKNVTHQACITGYTSAGMGMLGGIGSIYFDGNHVMQGVSQVFDNEFSEILSALSTAATPDEYAAAAKRCQEYYAANVPAVALLWDSQLQAVSSDFSGFVYDADWGILNTATWLSVRSESSARNFRVGTVTPIENADRSDYNYNVMSASFTQLSLVSRIISEDGNAFVPLLADYSTADSVSWTFTIRDGMTWSDGVSVTGEDVKFTFEYLDEYEGRNWLRDQTNKDGTVAKRLLRSVDVSEDGRSVTLVYETANPRALSYLSNIRIMPAHVYEGKTIETATAEENRIGCGVYKFSSFDKNKGTITFVPNPYFPVTEGAHIFDTVTVNLMGNTDTMYLKLKNGEFDTVYKYSGGVDPSVAQTLEQSGNINIIANATDNLPAVLAFNTSKAPFDNVNLRFAVAYAIDYAKFRELFASQYASPTHAGFAPPATIGYYDNTPVLARDVETAKKYLALALEK